VLPGAFKRSLAEHRKRDSLPQMFWAHDPSRVPGKWLEMREDERGLAVKGVLAPTELGNEIHTLLKMEAVRGLSIGYMTKDQDFTDEGDRLIKEADLWEVSIVSLPMNPLAAVANVKTRTAADGSYVPTARELEAHFRRIGCSKQTARKMIARIFDSAAGETLADDDADSGEMLEAGVQTGGTLVEPDEEAEVVRCAQRFTESYYADKIKRAIERGFK
jgi:HK97 family phage prohead protease